MITMLIVYLIGVVIMWMIQYDSTEYPFEAADYKVIALSWISIIGLVFIAGIDDE